MIEKNLSTQNTLFRIVSLRNPEKSNKEKQETRFVFYFEGQKDLQVAGLFYKAIKVTTTNKTKWQKLQEEATSFKTIAYLDEKVVEKLNMTFYAVSDWIAKNRKIAKPEELLRKVDGLILLDPKIEINLWDNLFYNVITDKNHYTKEAVIQMLVLQNLIKQNPTLENIVALANANVVLPIEIFEEDETIIAKEVKKIENETFSIPQSLYDAQEIQKAKNDIIQLENFKAELKIIEKKQRKEFQLKFKEAQLSYQKKIKPLVDNYNKEYNTEKFRLETLAQSNKEIKTDLINIQYPELPEFEFNTPKEIDSKTLQSKLSKEANQTFLDFIDWNDVESFQEIYNSIENKSNTVSKIILEKTVFSTQYASFGDMVFPLTKTNSTQVVSYILCAQNIRGNFYKLTITIDTSSNASSMKYYMKLQDGTTTLPHSIFNNNTTATLVLTDFFGPLGFEQDINNPVVGFFAEFKLSDGKTYTIDTDNFKLTNYNCTIPAPLTVKGDTTTTNDVAPNGFGFRQIGIADYKKVVTEICGYRAGEVAHIENIMAGETREKVTTKTHKSEVTDFQGQEIESEKLSDTTSTERFEMQTEIAKMLQEQTALDAHANVKANGVGWSLDAGAAYATNTTKEESNRQAVTQAKEQTQRAMERIVSRIKTERTVKITDEFIEANKHRFENLTNPSNVSGVYRFINAVYKNQIYNYGKRLMYEFMVPQPSKLHRLGLSVSATDKNALLLEKPIDPRTNGYVDFSSINETTYKTLIAKYGATNVKLFPTNQIYIGKSFNFTSQPINTVNTKVENIIIPTSGYVAKKVLIKFTGAAPGEDTGWGKNVSVTVGDYMILYDPNSVTDDIFYDIKEYANEVPVAIWATNYHAVTVTVTIICEITDDAIKNWKKETYEEIIKGYEEQLRQFNEKQSEIKAEGTKLLDSNPLFYRDTEQLILRKNCISYLIDNTNATSARKFGIKMYNEGMPDNDISFTNHQVSISQKMDDYTSFAKFMEQAFEWNLMSYNFYPFYWGNSAEWKDLYQFETNDPTYRSFMQAGMARVVVTVKPGFESAVMHYMAFGQIWNGGQTPILGNPLYLSIVDELKEQEYFIEDIWETVVPTNLVALQESGVSIAGGGLPNADSCIMHKDETIKLNDKTLTVQSPIK